MLKIILLLVSVNALKLQGAFLDRKRQERFQRDKDLLLQYERVLHEEEFTKLDQAMRQRGVDETARKQALENFNKSSG